MTLPFGHLGSTLSLLLVAGMALGCGGSDTPSQAGNPSSAGGSSPVGGGQQTIPATTVSTGGASEATANAGGVATATGGGTSQGTYFGIPEGGGTAASATVAGGATSAGASQGGSSTTATGGAQSLGGTTSRPTSTTTPNAIATLGAALQDPDVAAAAARTEEKCSAVAKRIGDCAGMGMGASKCKVMNWPSNLSVAGTQAVLECMNSRLAEYSCSDALSCAPLVDWYNRDVLGSCETAYRAMTAACPEQIRN